MAREEYEIIPVVKEVPNTVLHQSEADIDNVKNYNIKTILLSNNSVQRTINEDGWRHWKVIVWTFEKNVNLSLNSINQHLK